ncbi:hypothetical protein [Candidatus Nanopusillus massiliensis]|uniref:hypothetical protein n=1 Tax=Candidatus Nanopusillus massiliensis TaxID=2897163 RepID=UPI001E50664F|nr:hypothetical protein [Candidatus Nanopusillus massiliensis]
MKPIVVEYKRIGRSKNIEVRNDEIIMDIFDFYNNIMDNIFINKIYIKLFSIIKWFCLLFLLFLIFLYIYINNTNRDIIISTLQMRKGYTYPNKFIGDILILSTTPFYIASVLTIALLPIFSIIFNPIEVIIFS